MIPINQKQVTISFSCVTKFFTLLVRPYSPNLKQLRLRFLREVQAEIGVDGVVPGQHPAPCLSKTCNAFDYCNFVR